MLSKARATLMAAVLIAGAAAPVAQAPPARDPRPPRRHRRQRQADLHRGVARRLPPRGPRRLRARGRRQADQGRRPGRAPRRHARPHHHLHGRAAHLHARRPAPLQARRARQPRRRPRHPQRVAARLDRDDRRGARARPPDRGQGQPRDQERPDRPRLRPDARLREPGHGRRDRLGPAALAAAHPELHPREPRRGQAAPARRGDQPADLQLGPERHRPRRLVRLQVAVAAVAARRRLRGRRAPRPASRRPLHPQQARRRPRRRTREGRRADHRRPLDGRPRPRPAPGQEPDRQARPSSRARRSQRPAASRAAPARAP